MEELPKLSSKKIEKILNDPEQTARAVKLIYISDQNQEGITRKKKGKSFSYYKAGTLLKDKSDLERIKKLVIPPAWEDVWICALENGHLQATGLDARNRKQYRYHPSWNALRNHTKFYRMLGFADVLPAIRLRLEKDLALPDLCKEKVLAAVVSLMERTNIRVGNNVYEKLYGSFGLTTLKDKHIEVKGSKIHFMFKGKKGIEHDISLTNRKLARVIHECRDVPGRELFQYYAEDGVRHSVDSGMVNEYIREISGGDFTAKDFRTWAGTINAFIALKELGITQEDKLKKQNLNIALDKVAEALGNTRTVCKKYYVHPGIFQLYDNDGIQDYFDELDKIEKNDHISGLTSDEQVVLKLLQSLAGKS